MKGEGFLSATDILSYAILPMSAGVAELVDARDLKSRVPKGRAGSIPALGTKLINQLSIHSCLHPLLFSINYACHAAAEAHPKLSKVHLS